MTTETRPDAPTGVNTFLDPASEAARLHREASQHIPGGTSRVHYHFQPFPLYAGSGDGCRLTDADGVTRLDFLNNMTSLIHGHGHPATKRAIVEQLDRGTAFSEPAAPEIALARLLAERVGTIERIRFANSGTEAVMLAIKLARAFTGRSPIAKFEGFYHGYYDYVQVSFNTTPASWGPADEPASVPSSGGLADGLADDVLVLPYNNPAAIEHLLARHGHNIAALITDPLSNRAGFPLPGPGFTSFLRDVTRSYGIVLIYDEVISFRVAYDGAQGKYGGDPDLTTFGKIIGGGLPVGAVGGRADVMALLDPTRGTPTVTSGGTFSGNPLTMAAGMATLGGMTPDAYARLDALGARLRRRANEIFAEADEPGQIVGDGSLLRIVLTRDPIVDYRSLVRNASPTARLGQLHRNLLDEGVIISHSGLGALSTPMGDAEVDAFLAALEKSIRRLPKR